MISFMTATVDDSAELSELADRIMMPYYRAFVEPARLERFYRENQTPAMIRQQIAVGHHHYWFIDENGQHIGYLALVIDGRSALLSKLYVDENCRSRGIGTAAFARARTEAAAAGCDRLYLHVDMDNQAAIAFYRRQGMQIGQMRPDDLEQGHGGLYSMECAL